MIVTGQGEGTGAVIDDATITNVTGNGHTVTYDRSASADGYLGGRTHALTNGGTLTPA